MQTSTPPAQRPQSLLTRWGTLMARYAVLVLLLWLPVIAGASALYPVLQDKLRPPTYTVGGSESDRTDQVVARSFPDLGAEQAVLVLRSAEGWDSSPRFRLATDRVERAVAVLPGVIGVVGPSGDTGIARVSADGRTALVLVGLRGEPSERSKTSGDVQRTAHQAAAGDVLALLTGGSALNNDLSHVELRDQRTAEAVGIPIALVVLVLALGALVAAALPLVTSIVGVLLCMGLLALVAEPFGLTQFVTVIATMIGLGVGIDYGLFMVSRFREELALRDPAGVRRRHDPVSEAVGRAMHTSGRTVLASGIIVMVALCSMVVIRGHVFREIALAAATVVACSMLVNLTLLPALLGLLGRRVNTASLPRRLRPAELTEGATGRWGAWARHVMRHPWVYAVAVVVGLLVCALPLTSVRLGMDLGLPALGSTDSGRAQRLVAESFEPGSVGPVQVVVRTSGAPIRTSDLDAVAALTRSLKADPRVARVFSPTDLLDATGGHSQEDLQRATQSRPLSESLRQAVDLRPNGGTALVTLVTSVPVDSPDAMALVRDLRSSIIPTATPGLETTVGGLTAQYVDLSDETLHKLPLVVATVLALSLGYLLVVFRSIVLPLKAVVMNLLATAAALGVTVFVFQQGHGQSLLGFTSVGTLQAYLPVAMFTLLFGLSMDYEVFLVRRMQEEWLRTEDNAAAVATALAHTGRQITAAAAIMIAVFGSFVVADVLELKQFGFGLAIAVAIDATIIRMVLVPAVMALAGRWNWWLPEGLARRLPRLALE